jgi:hypothetical protein
VITCPCCNGAGKVDEESVALVKTLFGEPPADAPGRQMVLKDYLEVSGVLVSFEHTYACYDQCRVHARIPGCRESWGMDIPLPAHYDYCTVAQFDKAVLDFFNRFDDPLVKCSNPACQNMTWNRKHFPSQYRDTRCSTCWFENFNAEHEIEAAKEVEAGKRKDREMKAKGFTHAIDAWIHPGGGDDYTIVVYLNREPTKGDIAKALRQSIVKTDYSTRAL